MVKAIEYGNGRLVDGRSIRVNKATFGWKDRFSKAKKQSGSSTKSEQLNRGPAAFRDVRTFKEVLLGEDVKSTPESSNPMGIGNNESNSNKGVAEECVNKHKKVEYDLNIPKVEMEWLSSSAKGILKEGIGCRKVSKVMLRAGVVCQVSPLDNFSALLTFESKEVMKNMIKDNRVSSWFTELVPWEETVMERELFAWVILEEVPLQVWHVKFFESLGNSWGRFIKLDENTINKSRFDVARMLVRVDSNHDIPATVSVMVRGSFHKIRVTEEESMVVEEVVGEASLVKGDLP